MTKKITKIRWRSSARGFALKKSTGYPKDRIEEKRGCGRCRYITVCSSTDLQERLEVVEGEELQRDGRPEKDSSQPQPTARESNVAAAAAARERRRGKRKGGTRVSGQSSRRCGGMFVFTSAHARHESLRFLQTLFIPLSPITKNYTINE